MPLLRSAFLAKNAAVKSGKLLFLGLLIKMLPEVASKNKFIDRLGF